MILIYIAVGAAALFGSFFLGWCARTGSAMAMVAQYKQAMMQSISDPRIQQRISGSIVLVLQSPLFQEVVQETIQNPINQIPVIHQELT